MCIICYSVEICMYVGWLLLTHNAFSTLHCTCIKVSCFWTCIWTQTHYLRQYIMYYQNTLHLGESWLEGSSCCVQVVGALLRTNSGYGPCHLLSPLPPPNLPPSLISTLLHRPPPSAVKPRSSSSPVLSLMPPLTLGAEQHYTLPLHTSTHVWWMCYCLTQVSSLFHLLDLHMYVHMYILNSV